MLKVANRVKESTLTSGSGTIALVGASNGYQSFSSVLASGDTSYYTIVNGDGWEVGIGTYSSNTLSRDVILSSSNSNNKLNLNGESYVFIAYPSEKSVYKDQNDQVVVGSSGVIIGSGNPFITSNVLYNSGGILYFNGLPVSNSISITGVSGIGVSQSGNSYTISTTGSFGLTSSQVQQLLNSGVSINVISGTGNFNSLSISGTPVSISGHSHIASSITDFNSSVSGLIPVKNIVNSGYVVVSSSSGIFTIGVTGLQPSGNYSLSGHNHTASNITDFNSATSGLLTPYAQLDDAIFNNLAVDTLFTSNTPNFVVDEDGNTSIGGSNQLVDVGVPNLSVLYSLSAASGTISSGLNVFNYLRLNNTGVSLSGHSHTVSDILNFGSGVSGLLPVRDIIAGTGIAISKISGVFTISSSGSAGGSSNVTISNSGVGRLLASDGTSSGIIGQSDLTFINNNLTANGVIINNGNNLYMWSNFR